MWEKDQQVADRIKKLLTYLNNKDTRNKNVRQHILTQIQELKSLKECHYCDSVSHELDETNAIWKSQTNLQDSFIPTKDFITKTLETFIETETSQAQEEGKKLLRELDAYDLRKNEDRKKALAGFDRVFQIEECETCDALIQAVNQIKKLPSKEILESTIGQLNTPASESLLIEMDSADLRKKTEKKKIFAKIGTVLDATNCEITDIEDDTLGLTYKKISKKSN
jgi:hypothetical protein